jgi:hypothetical protein
MRAGRPSKLTEEVQRKIVEALAAGATFRAACEYVGVAESTGLEWLAPNDMDGCSC